MSQPESNKPKLSKPKPTTLKRSKSSSKPKPETESSDYPVFVVFVLATLGVALLGLVLWSAGFFGATWAFTLATLGVLWIGLKYLAVGLLSFWVLIVLLRFLTWRSATDTLAAIESYEQLVLVNPGQILQSKDNLVAVTKPGLARPLRRYQDAGDEIGVQNMVAVGKAVLVKPGTKLKVIGPVEPEVIGQRTAAGIAAIDDADAAFAEVEVITRRPEGCGLIECRMMGTEQLVFFEEADLRLHTTVQDDNVTTARQAMKGLLDATN